MSDREQGNDTFRKTEEFKIFLKGFTDRYTRFHKAISYVDDLESVIAKNFSAKIDAENYYEKLEQQLSKAQADLELACELVEALLLFADNGTGDCETFINARKFIKQIKEKKDESVDRV